MKISIPNPVAAACGIVVTAAVFLSPIAHAQAPAHAPAPLVREGATVKVTGHVYVIPDFKVPAVPNVGIVVGSRATLVVDPGLGMRSGEAVLREVRKVSRHTELYIVNTHFHPEHTTGEMAFPADTRIVRAAAQQQDIDEMGMKWVEIFSQRSPDFKEALKGVTAFRAPAEVFERDKTIDLGGVRVRLLRLGPGHTRGDTVIFVEGDRVLFSGDLAMKQLFPAFATPQSSARTWLTSLDQMDALQASKLVPAHGEMTDPSTIEAYRGFLKSLQTRVGELKRQGMSSDETAELLRAEYRANYPDWEQPLRVHGAAAAIYQELP
jgi:glyoxylase-like metal-dependent hydrolase (beta-lactamase superfamily II)